MEKSQPAARKVWPNLKRLCVCNMCQTIAQLSMKLDANPSTHTHTHHARRVVSTNFTESMWLAAHSEMCSCFVACNVPYCAYWCIVAIVANICAGISLQRSPPTSVIHSTGCILLCTSRWPNDWKMKPNGVRVVQPIAVEVSWETFTDREIIIGNRCVPFCSLAPPP